MNCMIELNLLKFVLYKVGRPQGQAFWSYNARTSCTTELYLWKVKWGVGF